MDICSYAENIGGIYMKPLSNMIEEWQTSNEMRLTELETQNLILMDALATTFEEILLLHEKIDTGGAG